MGIVSDFETAAASTQMLRSVSPSTGELVQQTIALGAAEVREAVRRAHVAQESWRHLTIRQRAAAMMRFRDALVQNAEGLVDWIVRETGKPRNEALLHEVATSADLITYYCKNAARILAPREIPVRVFRHRKAYVHYAPMGVIGIVSPWNYPMIIPLSSVVPALLSGSAAVLKPSEASFAVAIEIKRIWDQLGVAPDLFMVVAGYGPTAQALIDADIQLVHFTGSVANGRKVAEACAQRLIPCVLELGGKAPLIACADADVDTTARAIVFGGFGNAGQVCLSVERVYAHADIHDALVERVVELTHQLNVGDPESGWVDVGPMTVAHQITHLQSQVADALDKGAVLRCGGKRAALKGQFYLPTVLTGCDHRMRVMIEESFGPILPFMKVDSDEHALELANALALGLNAYVFTANREHGRRIAERLEAGNVLVNDVLTNYAMPEIPFGGVKNSGWGHVHGEEGLRDLCQMRHVSYDRVKPLKRNPLAFPYTAQRFRWMLKALRTVYGGGEVFQKIRELL
jgi:acyl-CoA reductase-like NAD-dependent aldehyde dehydrogenase